MPNQGATILERFYHNPTPATCRLLKAELALLGLDINQVFPDLGGFLAWKGKSYLYPLLAGKADQARQYRLPGHFKD